MVDTINKIKNVQIGYVGSDGLFDSATVNAYVSSLRGLSTAQAEVALSSAGLDKAQQKQILNKLTETKTTIDLTSAEATEALTRKLGSQEAANSLLMKAGLVTETQLQNGVTISLNKELLNEAVLLGKITQEEAEQILTTFGLSGANVSLGTTFELLAIKIQKALAAMAKWLVMNPWVWGIAGGLALAGVIDYLTVSYEEANKALDEANEKYKETQDNIASLNAEYDTNKEKIEELQKLQDNGTITDSQKEELENLENKNKQLETQIALQKELLELQNKDKAEAAKDVANAESHSVAQSVELGDETGKNTFKQTVGSVTDAEAIKEDLALIDEYESKVSSLEEDLINAQIAVSNAESPFAKWIAELKVSNIEKEIQKYKDSLATLYEDLQTRSTNAQETLESLKLDPKTNADEIKIYETALASMETQLLEVKDAMDAVNETQILDEETLNKNVNESYDTIKSSYDALQEFKDAMSNGMTQSALDGVAELSDELKVMVAGYHAGAVSADELYEALTDHYNTDLKNYGDALIAKHQDDVDFCNAVGLNSAEVTNQFLEDYHVDLSNHKTYAEKKLALENEILGKISKNWAKYYNAQTKTFTSQMTMLENEVKKQNSVGGGAKLPTGLMESTISNIYSVVSEYEAAVDELNNITYKGIESNFDGISSALSSNSGSNKDTEETFDWIQVAIERLEREISNLDKIVNATYKSWTERNKNLESEISKVTDEITLQKDAYKKYMDLANSVGLDQKYQELVKSGGLDYSTIKDEKLAEKIKKYQEFYELAIACEDKLVDLEGDLANLARQKFDNITAEFENLMSGIEHELNMLDAYVSQTEERGRFVSTKYYSSMISLEKQNIALLESEYSKLNTSLNEAVNSGQIQKYSEEWYNMAGEINSVSEELVEANTSVIEFQNSIRELEWEVFDKLQEFISQIQGEAEFLQKIMSDEKMFDDEGSITDQGRATLGLHAVNYETYMRQANDYAEELKNINEEIAKDPNNLTLLERRQELLETQRDMITAAEDEKQAMKDLVSEGYDTFLNYMQELIDKRKEAMQSIKDMYDYEKNISDQTDEIARLQKIIDSYGGDNSEEAKAKLQEYTVQLQDAKEALEETEYERYLSDQEKMLNNLTSETEEWISNRLDNLDGLVSGVIDSTNENAESIKETLISETEKVGITLTDEMNSIWSTDGSAGKVVSMYGDGFNSHLTTISGILSEIKNYINSMVENSDKEAIDGSANVQNSTSTTPTVPSGFGSTANGHSSSGVSTTNSATTSSSTSSSNGSNSEWGSWFISKRNYVNKSKLNKDTSIVDRLKYFDFNETFEARQKYYKAMGGSDAYIGSSKQNQWMVSEMKKHGFAKGGTIGNLISRAGEDGIILARTGEEILSLEKIEALRNTFKEITPIMNLVNNIPKIPKYDGIGNRVINNIEMSVILENVNNYEDIFEKFRHDTTGQKFIQQLTLGNALGKNGLAKFKYC